MLRLFSISIALRFLLLSGLLLSTNGCQRIGDGLFGGRIQEGVIHYDVSFPYSDMDGLVASLLPSKMTMKFEKGRYVTELIAGMGMFRMRFISDNDKKTLQIMKEKKVVKLKEKETKKMLQRFPELDIFPSMGSDTIAGIPCRRSTGVFEPVEEPSMKILHTDRIALKDPNWCNQFHELNGVLMAYEIERFGKRMRLKADKVVRREIPDSAFSTKGYERIGMEAMNRKMKELMKSFE